MILYNSSIIGKVLIWLELTFFIKLFFSPFKLFVIYINFRKGLNNFDEICFQIEKQIKLIKKNGILEFKVSKLS